MVTLERAENGDRSRSVSDPSIGQHALQIRPRRAKKSSFWLTILGVWRDNQGIAHYNYER